MSVSLYLYPPALDHEPHSPGCTDTRYCAHILFIIAIHSTLYRYMWYYSTMNMYTSAEVH